MSAAAILDMDERMYSHIMLGSAKNCREFERAHGEWPKDTPDGREGRDFWNLRAMKDKLVHALLMMIIHTGQHASTPWCDPDPAECSSHTWPCPPA